MPVRGKGRLTLVTARPCVTKGPRERTLRKRWEQSERCTAVDPFYEEKRRGDFLPAAGLAARSTRSEPRARHPVNEASKCQHRRYPAPPGAPPETLSWAAQHGPRRRLPGFQGITLPRSSSARSTWPGWRFLSVVSNSQAGQRLGKEWRAELTRKTPE